MLEKPTTIHKWKSPKLEWGPPLCVSMNEAGRLLGVCRSVIEKRIGEGTLKDVKIGRRHLVVYESLKQLLAPDAEKVKVTVEQQREAGYAMEQARRR